jgi:hypothetical protein
MRSMPSRPALLALLLLPLLSTACVTRSTPASIARTERPRLPKLSAELTRTERLAPIAAEPTGELVTIDRGVLAGITSIAAEAIGAVERLNARIGGIIQERVCTAGVFETGVAPPGCR